jgi:hypothetical protein
LGDSPASGLYWPTFRNPLPGPWRDGPDRGFRNVGQTPGNYPKVDIINTENGESLKSRIFFMSNCVYILLGHPVYVYNDKNVEETVWKGVINVKLYKERTYDGYCKQENFHPSSLRSDVHSPCRTFLQPWSSNFTSRDKAHNSFQRKSTTETLTGSDAVCPVSSDGSIFCPYSYRNNW